MFGGLHREAMKAYARAGKLFKLHLDLLYQCDLDCEHCYLDDKKKKILPTGFWKGVLDQAAAMGVFALVLSGGEIFLRKDLLELVAHARRLGLFVNMKSHGGFIDDHVASQLAALGVTSVWLSYYSPDAAVHDAITRKIGSHAATLAAFSHLRRHDVTAVASIVVMQRNQATWRDAVAQCERLGVLPSVDGHLLSALSGAAFPKELAVDMHEAIALERHHLERVSGDCTPAQNDPIPWEQQKNCGAGHTSLYVSPEGDVTPCIMWPMPLGNLARGDRLAELWTPGTTPALDRIRATRSGDREVCSRCEVRDDCDFCAGQSFIETKDPNAAIANFCRKTRAKTLARAELLGLPEPPMPAGLLREPAPKARFVVRAAPMSPTSTEPDPALGSHGSHGSHGSR